MSNLIKSIVLLAVTISIYDSPTDRRLAVVEVCGPTKCARLLTPRLTLEQDYAKIEAWVNNITSNLE